MKQNSKVVLGATLTTAMCASLIAGTTYALFTSESEVNIAITSAKLAVNANISKIATDYDAAHLTGVNEALSAKYDKAAKTLTILNMSPGDKVTFQVNVTASSTIAFRYRFNFGFENRDDAFSRQFLVGIGDPAEDGADVAYTYYASNVSEWISHAATDGKEEKPILTKEVSVELPYYVNGEQYMNQSCNLSFGVVAVQGNADISDDGASALQAHIVKDQNGIDTAIENMKDGESLILWNDGNGGFGDAEINTEAAKKFVINGDKVGTFTVNAPNAEIEYYNAYTNMIKGEALKGESLHIFGETKELLLNKGRAVIESGASVEKVTANVAENASATVVIAEEAKANTVAVENGKVTVEHSGVIGTLSTKENTEVTLIQANGAKIENEAVAKGTVTNASIIKVNDETSLFAAIEDAEAGSIIKLTDDFNVNQAIMIGKSLTIKGNGHTITTTATRGIRIIANQVELSLIDLKLKQEQYKDDSRGAQIDGPMEGVKLYIRSSEIHGFKMGIFVGQKAKAVVNIEDLVITSPYYAVNISNGAEVDLTIKDSEITGWGAINAWSAGYNIRISDSILRGVNDKSFDADGWNGFGTVVLEGDTTNKTDDASERIDVELKNCRIIAESKTGNIQKCILFNSKSKENHVKLIDCTLETENNDCIDVMDNGTGNVVTIIDTKGKLVQVSNSQELIAALANAKDGDIIQLAAGTYSPTANEQFVLKANHVTLFGAGANETILDAQAFSCSGQAGFLVSGNHVTMRDLTVKTASTNGDVSALKVTKVSPEAGFVEGFKLGSVIIEGSKGHGLNLHTVKDALIHDISVRSFAKVGISLAEAVNVKFMYVEVTKQEKCWADVGFMYAENNAMYDTPSEVTFVRVIGFKNGTIYSERPESATYDSVTIKYGTIDENTSDIHWNENQNEKGQAWTAPAPAEPDPVE